MNRPAVRLYAFILILFALLVWKTSQWAVFDADELQAQTANRRPLIETQTVHRGTIKTSDGVLLAQSSPEGGGPHPIYVRHYQGGPLYGNPMGYFFLDVSTGIERSENAFLSGEENEFVSILDELRGIPREGDNVTLTIDSQAQQAGANALGSQKGAVVALDPSTGAVKAMVSVPGFDPNIARDPANLSALNKGGAATSPLFNRATQTGCGTAASGYPPGSTMKVVTAAAALDSGTATPDSTYNGASPQTFSGVPLQNFGNEQFGDITLTDALTHSVNTVFAQVGEQLGTQTMFDYMDRFGFDQDPQLDYPDDQMAPSGVCDAGKLLGPSDSIDIARVAIGQERLTVTPLQMAEVAAAVGNDGKLMKPNFVQEVTDPDGRVIDKLEPREQSQVMSSESAAQLQDMMTHVVEEGTAAGLSIGGTPFAGKTGTAENPTGACPENQAWFIAFAPVDDPTVAVAATVECTSQTGAEAAGPIATAVMQSLLSQ